MRSSTGREPRRPQAADRLVPTCCVCGGFDGIRTLLRGGAGAKGRNTDVSNRIGISIVNIAGEQVASLQVGHTDTVAHVKTAVCRLPMATAHSFCLVSQGAVLQAEDTLLKSGVGDGAVLTLVRLAGPRFQLITQNVEITDGGAGVRVAASSRSGWGWATAFASEGVESITISLGRTASREANVTDYFIGALPEEFFQPATSQNFLGDKGVGLVLSSHSHWSGSLKVRGDHRSELFGGRKFHPGDVVSVSLDKAAGTVRFGSNGEWTTPVAAEFAPPIESVRLGVSMYCDMSSGPMRSVEICMPVPGD